MRLARLFKRYSLLRRPTLRVVNPRVGTSIIPLNKEDGEILFQYLGARIHSLYFDGTEKQLCKIIEKFQVEQGFTIQRMKMTWGREREKLMHVHLKFPNELEIRRIIRMV